MKYVRPPDLTKAEFRKNRTLHYNRLYPVCIEHALSVCRSRNIRAFKTIRMTLTQAFKIVKEHPDVKVIYSTRDPRGMASSRYKIDLQYKYIAGMPPFRQRVVEQCVRVRNDLNIVPKLQQEFPNNFFSSSFEDLVKDPVAIADRVYAFLGLQMPEAIKEWVQRQVKNHDNGPHSNATVKWKSTLSDDMLLTLKEECADLISLLGIK